MTIIRRIFDTLRRWQEFTGWTPLLVLLVLAGYVLLGALYPRLDGDRLGLLLELAIVSAYAMAAVGLTYLSWRRWRQQLDPEQQLQLWDGVMRGDRGPMLVYAINAVVWLATLVAWLAFFYVVR
ncbi:hypothetical protein BGP89_11405 [Luteimonas sp. JM171]|uniref:hypothetical protein n=1 Tax=Luteimonas sp. JM171 TaxID=1896164 RepID=UPI000855F5C9|nr:hypothetical protein [Luteimonas sp. JM171]AOH36886.1 hypothetical protein BGP89_11405 [Luteimonas sp. JM171]